MSSKINRHGPENSSSAGFLRITALILLPLLSLLGFYSTMIVGSKNGFFNALVRLADSKASLYPGTKHPFLESYTGLRLVDRQLKILVGFFAPVSDMANEDLRIFSIFGGGQFGGAWALLQLESMRFGSRGRAISFISIVGFFIQTISYTVTVPLYLLAHLLTSPVARTVEHNPASILVPILDLVILPVSIVLGYVAPTVLMVLPPTVVPSALHQRFIAFWQPFPIWTVIIQMSLRTCFNQFSDTSAESRPSTTSYLRSVKRVYASVFWFCTFAQARAILLSISVIAKTSSSSFSIYSRLANSPFASAFVPYWPTPGRQVPDLASGSLTFLQWDVYVGSFALLIWAIVLYRSSAADASENGLKGISVWKKLALKVACYTLLSGPVGCVSMLLSDRDELALARQEIKKAS